MDSLTGALLTERVAPLVDVYTGDGVHTVTVTLDGRSGGFLLTVDTDTAGTVSWTIPA